MAKFTGHPITDDSALGGSVIERSLRFNREESTAPQLRRTGTTTSSSFSIAMWAKLARVQDTFRFFFSIGQENDANAGWVGVLDGQNMGFQGGNGTYTTITRVFRDPISWFHFLISVNSNNFTVYIDGTSVHTGTIRSLDTSTNGIRIGANYGNAYPWDGYLADVYLIDGQAKLPTDFGYTESQTGLWRPKKYTGTFGTGGAHLEFKDSSSVAALGKDTSGNGNDFTPTTDGFNVSAGSGNDSMLDTPTNNFCTLNPVDSGIAGNKPINGNLQGQNAGTSGWRHTRSTIPLPSSGKWYWEYKVPTTATDGSNGWMTGIAYSNLDYAQNINSNSTGLYGRQTRGKYNNSSSDPVTDNHFSTPSDNDIFQFAYDANSQALYTGRNNTWELSANPSTGANPNWTGVASGGFPMVGSYGSNRYVILNCGQQGFSYTPPTGYKALSSKNLPPNVSSIIRPQKHFDTLTWTGASTVNSRVISGLEFQPDWVWIKCRSHSSYGGGLYYHHNVWDSVRGPGNASSSAAGKNLCPNNSTVEGSTVNIFTGFYGHVSSFNKDGFTVQRKSGEPPLYTDENSKTYVAWCWKAGGTAVSNSDGSITSSVSANTEAGFSIVTWTGSGADASIGHGLGKKPQAIFVKNRSATDNWRVWWKDITVGDEYALVLNDSTGVYTGTDKWYNSPNGNDTTTTTFGVSDDGSTNRSGELFVGYCWTSIPGYSKIGTYTGNGNADGTYVHLGFRPAWLMVKKTSGANSWVIFDAKRSTTNLVDDYLIAEGYDAEATSANVSLDFLSSGFKFQSGYDIVNAGTYAFMAFAEQPGTTPFETFPNAR